MLTEFHQALNFSYNTAQSKISKTSASKQDRQGHSLFQLAKKLDE
jgi:hypothetical protein